MAYLIEFALDNATNEAFYAEFVIVNKNTKKIIQTTDVDHQLVAYRGDGPWPYGGSIIASNTNGLITSPEPGVVALNVPVSSFSAYLSAGCWDYGFHGRSADYRSLNCQLVAVPAAGAAFTKTIAHIVLSFGQRQTLKPRVMQGALPIYPNKDDA